MNKAKLKSEIRSKGLQEVAASLSDVLNLMRSKKLQPQEAASIIAGHKHVLQAISLDWKYSKMTKDVEAQVKIAGGK